MRVLVIGLNGFVGSAIAYSACARGYAVFGMGRAPQSNSSSGAMYIRADRSNPKHVLQIVVKYKIDIVVDVIPMVFANTQPLLDCLDGVVEQYVMISSNDVYANYELLHKRTHGTPIPFAVDENSPLRTTVYPYREKPLRRGDDPQQYLDDYDKIPIETAVRQLSSAWTILRLPMVYGPGDKQKRFRWAIAPMVKKQEAIVIPRNWANWQSTYGYIENVGAAIAATLGQQNAHNQIFNVAEEAPISQLAWAQKFAETTGWRGVIDLTDNPGDAFGRRISGLDLDVPFKINGDKLRQTFGFSDVVDEPTALERTVASEA